MSEQTNNNTTYSIIEAEKYAPLISVWSQTPNTFYHIEKDLSFLNVNDETKYVVKLSEFADDAEKEKVLEKYKTVQWHETIVECIFNLTEAAKNHYKENNTNKEEWEQPIQIVGNYELIEKLFGNIIGEKLNIQLGNADIFHYGNLQINKQILNIIGIKKILFDDDEIILGDFVPDDESFFKTIPIGKIIIKR